MAYYGYIRVSSNHQNTDRQIMGMCNLDIHKYFVDKTSGQNFNRPAYQKMLKKIKSEDVVVVASIDRFGRNYKEILKQWEYITKDIGADIVVLDMPILDTRNDNNDLTGVFLSDIILQLLSYVAQIEREQIKKRQREGIIAAQSKGVKFGRPRLDYPKNFKKLFVKYKNKELSLSEFSQILKIDKLILKKHIGRYKKQLERDALK